MALIHEIDKQLNSGTREVFINRDSAMEVGEEELKEIVRLCKINGVYLLIEGVGEWDFRK